MYKDTSFNIVVSNLSAAGGLVGPFEPFAIDAHDDDIHAP